MQAGMPAPQAQIMELTIATPPTFNFKRTVISHGWCELLPFRMDRENWVLSRALDLPNSQPVTISMISTRRTLRINMSRRLNQSATKKVVSDVRHMLRLDDDMREFYRMLADDGDFGWIPIQGAGRMLRSPTVFEDLVK